MELTGISHLTFIVKNLDRMSLFLCEGLGAKEVYDSGDENFSLSREKFFVLAGTWIAAMEGSPTSERSYNHVAFKVASGELEHFEKRLRNLGVEIKQARSRVQGEGKSLYFYDFDNHLFELHEGNLNTRLDRYAKRNNAETE